MRISLCNEVLAPRPFAEQCAIAAALGYLGLEVAPYTVADDPAAMSEADARALAQIAADHGLVVTGLHWLLVKPEGLSITSADDAVHARTIAFMQRLCELCAAMGGRYLVHGSPRQRLIADGQSAEHALERATAAFAAAGDAARACGVTYCIEPLARDLTPLLNTVAQAAALVRAVGNPHLRTMIDTCAAARTEDEEPAALIARWLPSGLIAHVQVNDPNLRGPGQGNLKFAPILSALADGGYDGCIAVEPFEYLPDGIGCAARSIGYLDGILQCRGSEASDRP